MRDLDLTSLRQFVAVCETRNMVRAAAQSNVVASAISKRIAQLEANAGVRLLQRRRHGVEPTAAGFTLLEHAREMLAAADRIGRAMDGYAAGVRGEVRVLASASALAESLADDIAAFLAIPAHRDIQVSFEERVSQQIVRGVREGSAALGVCWDASDLGGLAHSAYRQDELVVVVHPAHPLAARQRLRYEETLDYEQVSMPVNSAVNLLLARAAASVGRRVLQRVVVTSFEAALRVVRAGLALSVVPREIAAPYLDSWELRAIALDERWAPRRFAICYRSEAALGTPALALLQHLVTAARGNP